MYDLSHFNEILSELWDFSKNCALILIYTETLVIFSKVVLRFEGSEWIAYKCEINALRLTRSAFFVVCDLKEIFE